MQSIKNTQAGFLYWQDRTGGLRSPLLGDSLQDRLSAAQKIGTAIGDWAKEANRWQLGAGEGGYKQSYGGFSGA